MRKVSSETPSIVGCSAALARAKALVDRYAPVPDPVLLLGPTGTGKGLFARALHHHSRRTGPLVQLAGGQLVDTLYQTQLFGHTRGAYTGALRDTPGAFEQARDGTLFLDELPLWSRAAQAAVLQAVEEGWVRPVGAARDLPVTCRLVFGSNRPLASLALEGRLMEDLLYRIGEFVIEVPPLTERRVDIAVLAFHYLDEERGERAAIGPIAFTPTAFRQLLGYDWPGNVRQLKNAIRFAHLHAAGRERIDLEHLPACVRDHKGRVDETTLREVTAWALETSGRDRRAAARRLGVHPNTIDYRLRTSAG